MRRSTKPEHIDTPPGFFGYLCVCSTALFFSYLTLVDPVGVATLAREDHWVENVTAISFLLAGLPLFATAWMERNSVRCCVYILGGLAMVFAVGEEINWGQRIFGFDTPDSLLDVNAQKEVNIHNIPPFSWMFFLSSHKYASLLLCTVTSAAFFCRKDELFGIPLPSIFLVLCLLLMLSYRSNIDPYTFRIHLSSHYIRWPFRVENALLLILLLFALFHRKTVLFTATLAVMTFSFAHAYTNSRSDVYPTLLYGEIQEILFGLFCFFYAVELFWRFRIMNGASRRPGTPFHPEEDSGGRIAFASSLSANVRPSMIGGICALIVAGNTGLAIAGYFSTEITSALIEKGYSRIKNAKPIIRSGFDVYRIEGQLIYFKTPCAPFDTRQRFFLHVIPIDVDDLPRDRGYREIGFDDRYGYTSVWLDATHAGGRCMAIVPLPDYEVASITTGQHKSWKETFSFIEQPR